VSSSRKNSKKTNISLDVPAPNLSKVLIPSDIFLDRNLTPLEAIVRFLRLRKNLSYYQISKLLRRHIRDIYKIHQNSEKKPASEVKISLVDLILIPVEVFSDSRFHALEAVTVYLHDNLNLKFSQIADLLNRDQRTIWTVYSRARKKNAK